MRSCAPPAVASACRSSPRRYPGVLDGLVRKASEAHFPRAIKAGVKIHEYGPALLHAKTLVVDERLVSIGSANLDNRLFALNNELNVVFQDGVIAAQLIKVFHQI